MLKFKSIMATLAVAAGVTGGLMSVGTTEASAKTTVRSYQNIKNRSYRVANKKAVVYTTAKLNHKHNARLGQYGSKVTGYYAAHVTKSGKKAIYYKFKSANGSTGWVWHGWLKKSATSSNSNLPTNWYDGNDNSQTTAPKTPTTTKKLTAKLTNFSESDYSNTFLMELNKERAKHGASPITLDDNLTQIAKTRTANPTTMTTHTDQNGNHYFVEIAKQLNINYARSECLGLDVINAVNHGESSDDIIDPTEPYNIQTNTSAGIAKSSILEYIHFDAGSDNGHRDILLNPNYNVIGISAIIDGNYANNCIIMGTK